MTSIKNEILNNKCSILVLFYSIYFSTKIMWDKYTSVFELFSVFSITCFALLQIIIIIRHKEKKLISIFSVWLIFVAFIVLQWMFKNTGIQFFLRSMYEYVFYSMIMWAFYLLADYIDFNRIMKILCVLGVAIAFLSFVEFVGEFHIIPLENYGTYVEFNGEMVTRAKVFTRSYLSHGIILGVFSLFNCYTYMRERKLVYLFSSLFCYIAILTTASRGPLVAVTGAYIIYYVCIHFEKVKTLISLKKFNLSYKFILVLGVGILLLLFIFSDMNTGLSFIDYSLTRVRSIFNWTGDPGNVGRIEIWGKWIITIKENILTGIGASMTGSWNPISLGVTESDILKKLVELGIIGFTIYYLYISKILYSIISTLNSNKRKVEISLCIAIISFILIDGVVLQVSEEIMVSFFLYAFMGIGLNYSFNISSDTVNTKKKILYYSQVDWFWIKQRPHILAEGIADYYDLTFVYQHRYNRKIMQKTRDTVNIQAISPIYVIPKGDDTSLLRKVNDIIRKTHIHIILALHKYDIIVITYPSQITFIPEKFNGTIIYDCMDYHIAFLNNDLEKNELFNSERKAVNRADLILCSSKGLINTLKNNYMIDDKKHIELVRNAYGGNIIETVQNMQKKLKEVFKICYFGTISSWFDYSLLVESLKENEKIEYWLIGPIENGVNFNKVDRIHFVGTIEHNELYDTVKDMDCFIMPFKINPIIENVDPVKLYEYINFNKNIICVYYDEVARFSPFVYFYSNIQEYKNILNQLIVNNQLKYTNEERIEFLNQNNWDSRLVQIIQCIKKELL